MRPLDSAISRSAPARRAGARSTDATYSAPALEKGLDILELLAGEAEGLSQAAIAERLGRSTGEIFRMLARARAARLRRSRRQRGLPALAAPVRAGAPPSTAEAPGRVALPRMQALAQASAAVRAPRHSLRATHPRRCAGRQPGADGLQRASGRALPLPARPRVLAGTVGVPARRGSGGADRRAHRQQLRAPSPPSRCERSSHGFARRGYYDGGERHDAGVTDLCAPVFDYSEGAVGRAHGARTCATAMSRSRVVQARDTLLATARLDLDRPRGAQLEPDTLPSCDRRRLAGCWLSG